MQKSIKKVYQILIICGISTLFFIIALATPYIVNSTDFSIYNNSWNGCSNIAVKTYKSGKLQPSFYINQKELTLNQRSFVEYDIIPKESCIILIGPNSSFSKDEIMYIKNFVLSGGILFLADDFGSGNDLLNGINSSSRFSEDLLLDLSFEKSAHFCTIFNFYNHSLKLFNNVSRILFNYATSIIAGNNTEILISSSELSWLDKNKNNNQDQDEIKGPFPVFVIEDFGEGKIVLLSDPSLMLNSMNNLLDNRNFINNLIQYLLKNKNIIIIDESHRDISTPLKFSFLLPRSISVEVKICIVLLVIVIFIFFFTNIPKKLLKYINQLIIKKNEEKKQLSNEELVISVLKKHPNWKRKKLEEILRRLD